MKIYIIHKSKTNGAVRHLALALRSQKAVPFLQSFAVQEWKYEIEN